MRNVLSFEECIIQVVPFIHNDLKAVESIVSLIDWEDMISGNCWSVFDAEPAEVLDLVVVQQLVETRYCLIPVFSCCRDLSTLPNEAKRSLKSQIFLLFFGGFDLLRNPYLFVPGFGGLLMVDSLVFLQKVGSVLLIKGTYFSSFLSFFFLELLVFQGLRVVVDQFLQVRICPCSSIDTRPDHSFLLGLS